MPSVEILSYTAHVGQLGVLGADKFLVLRHRRRDGAGETVEASSEIYFADRFGATEYGFTTIGNEDSVRAHLPEAEYAVWIDLLRHEDPMFLHWTTTETPNTPDPEGIIHLATGPEPPGEGPVDLTP